MGVTHYDPRDLEVRIDGVPVLPYVGARQHTLVVRVSPLNDDGIEIIEWDVIEGPLAADRWADDGGALGAHDSTRPADGATVGE